MIIAFIINRTKLLGYVYGSVMSIYNRSFEIRSKDLKINLKYLSRKSAFNIKGTAEEIRLTRRYPLNLCLKKMNDI